MRFILPKPIFIGFAQLLLLGIHHSSFVLAEKKIIIASPLQSLTIPDREIKTTLLSHRQQYLPKFKAGLAAEFETRKEIATKRTNLLSDGVTSSGSRSSSSSNKGGEHWVEEAEGSERTRRTKEDLQIEKAFDMAVAQVEASEGKNSPPLEKSPNAYQFVGVINKKSPTKPITWYARKKPENAQWSVRLVHVNRDAIIKDLFNQGKVDIFAKYRNTGRIDEESETPIIHATYEVRERSWK